MSNLFENESVNWRLGGTQYIQINNQCLSLFFSFNNIFENPIPTTNISALATSFAISPSRYSIPCNSNTLSILLIFSLLQKALSVLSHFLQRTILSPKKRFLFNLLTTVPLKSKTNYLQYWNIVCYGDISSATICFFVYMSLSALYSKSNKELVKAIWEFTHKGILVTIC